MAAVFISYSRKDFYFAASVVLVGSRASSRSAYVTAEWRRALDEKKRIIIARFGAFDLPPALADAEVIDFRGTFQPALQSCRAYSQPRHGPKRMNRAASGNDAPLACRRGSHSWACFSVLSSSFPW
jgi:hypothetical protein